MSSASGSRYGINARDRREESSGLFVTQSPPLNLSRDARSPVSGSYESDEEIIDQSDDDEDDDEDDGDNYTQDCEDLPDHPAFDERTWANVDRAKNLLDPLLEKLSLYRHMSVDVEEMAAKVEAESDYTRYQKKKPRIMLLGGTGTGKSSTANSFVDDECTMRSVAGGDSCTCVPTLVCDELPGGQELDYAAEIRFFDSETRKEFLQIQIDNYNRYNFALDPDWTIKEKQEQGNLAAAAEKIFRALFCEQFEFESSPNIKDYLRRHWPDRRDAVLEKMMEWTDDLLLDHDQRNGCPYLSMEAYSGRELNDVIDPHIFEHHDFDEPRLWPLVEYVSKGIRSSRILRYVDLLDLPGTADKDPVRSSIAHRFVQQCDALWIVTMITRSVADAELDMALALHAERFGGNVAIIATCSDTNIDDALAHYMEEEKNSIGNYWDQSRRIQELQQQIAKNDRRLSTPSGNKRRKTLSERQKTTLFEENRQLSTDLRNLRNEQFEGLVSVRNSHVERSLKKSKEDYMKGNTLSVFCISNTHYFEFNQTGSDERRMRIESTNIPELRAHALRMAAPSKFHEAERFLQTTISRCGGIAMWVDSPEPYKRHKALMQRVRAPVELLSTSVSNHISASTSASRAGIMKRLKLDRQTSINAALRFTEELYDSSKWHASTIRAFFGRNGKHQTDRQIYEVWNERFTRKQTESILDMSWAQLVCGQQESLRKLVGKIIAQLEELPEVLNAMEESAPVPVRRIQTMLCAYISRINIEFEAQMEELSKAFATVKQNASRDVPTAYFSQAMIPMYDDCKTYRGKGCTRQMLEKLEEWLQQRSFDNPFDTLLRELEREFLDTTTSIARNLERDIRTILDEMIGQFNVILSGSKQTMAERQARSILAAFFKETKREYTAMMRELGEIKSQDRT